LSIDSKESGEPKKHGKQHGYARLKLDGLGNSVRIEKKHGLKTKSAKNEVEFQENRQVVGFEKSLK